MLFNSDNHLVARCLRGDSNSFGRLYERHAVRVFHLLRRLTGNAAEAEDLTQETFIAAYAALAGWRKEGAFGTWLCGIAAKRYANARRGQLHRQEPEYDVQETLAAPDSDPLLHYTRREREQQIEQAIVQLPELCREVFVLVKVEGFAYREAAELLEIPIGTVQSRLWRATRLLQNALNAENVSQGNFTLSSKSKAAPTQETKGSKPDALRNRA